MGLKHGSIFWASESWTQKLESGSSPCLAHVKPSSTGPDNSKESPSGCILRFDEVLSFKVSTCLAPGDRGALIPVLARSFCGPGQVTSSSEEGIHQVPHGPAEMAVGCKTILSSNGRRGRLEGALSSAEPAPCHSSRGACAGT